MACPTESRTLDEYTSAAPRYDSRQKSGIRKRLKEIGIRVYESFALGSKERYTPKIGLEKILGDSIRSPYLRNSAFREVCECHFVNRDTDPNCERQEERWSCLCENEENVPNETGWGSRNRCPCECEPYDRCIPDDMPREPNGKSESNDTGWGSKKRSEYKGCCCLIDCGTHDDFEKKEPEER
jgi:hypothetical protein